MEYSPDKVQQAGFFIVVDKSSLEGGNEFYKITATSTKVSVLAEDSVALGMLSREKASITVMFCKRSWLEDNFADPIISIKETIEDRERPRAIGYSRRVSNAPPTSNYHRDDSECECPSSVKTFVKKLWLIRLVCLGITWLLLFVMIILACVSASKTSGFPGRCLGSGSRSLAIAIAVLTIFYGPMWLSYLMLVFYKWDNYSRPWGHVVLDVIGFIIIASMAFSAGNNYGRAAPWYEFGYGGVKVKCNEFPTSDEAWDWASDFAMWVIEKSSSAGHSQISDWEVQEWMSDIRSLYVGIFGVMVTASIFWCSGFVISGLGLLKVVDLEK
jgi:hypothetical protein